jgi:hypothetical protein
MHKLLYVCVYLSVLSQNLQYFSRLFDGMNIYKMLNLNPGDFKWLEKDSSAADQSNSPRDPVLAGSAKLSTFETQASILANTLETPSHFFYLKMSSK